MTHSWDGMGRAIEAARTRFSDNILDESTVSPLRLSQFAGWLIVPAA